MRGWGNKIKDKIQKDQNPTSATYEELEQKQGVGSKSRILHIPSALNTTKGVGRPPQPPFRPDPWTHPYPHPI